MPLFHDRLEAAHELARHLLFLKSENPIVLGLANAGVPIAEVIAQALEAPLDVMLIERIFAPQNPNSAVGAVDEHGRISAIRTRARWHELSSQQMIAPAREVYRDLQRRSARVRAVLPELEVRDRTVIVVSQGVATGAKMLGAIASLRDRSARKVIAAAPAGAGKAAWQLHESADLVIIPHRPTKFTNIESLYAEYTPVTDELVMALVERWVKTRPQPETGIKTFKMKLANERGELLICEIDMPPGATRGSGPYPAALFAHEFKSHGRSDRAVPIARRLAEIGIISARLDFTGHGESEGDLKDVNQASMYNDLKIALNHLRPIDEVDGDRIGLIGAGSGATLALNLAAEDPTIKACAVRGPMSGTEVQAARQVSVPTLLIYTDEDEAFVKAVEDATSVLPSIHEPLRIPDSSRFYSDPISKKMMIGATVDWLDDHLLPIPMADSDEDSEASEQDAEPTRQTASGGAGGSTPT